MDAIFGSEEGSSHPTPPGLYQAFMRSPSDASAPAYHLPSTNPNNNNPGSQQQQQPPLLPLFPNEQQRLNFMQNVMTKIDTNEKRIKSIEQNGGGSRFSCDVTLLGGFAMLCLFNYVNHR